MYEIKEKSFQIDGLSVAYTETGPDDGRILFCVHGLLSNGRDYDFLALYFAERGYRVIAMDLPGRGKSEWLADRGVYEPPTYFPYCMALIAHVTQDQPFDYLGVSLGGIIGMPLATLEAVQMERLILVDIGPEISGEALDMVSKIGKAPSSYPSMDDAMVSLKMRCMTWGIKDDKFWRHLAKHSLIEQDDGTVSFHYDPEIGTALKDKNENADFWDIWSVITKPVLLLRGEFSSIVPSSLCDDIRARYNGRSLDIVTVKECGHVPNLMEDEQHTILHRWLNSVM